MSLLPVHYYEAGYRCGMDDARRAYELAGDWKRADLLAIIQELESQLSMS